jgi:hypothetical protein
MATKRPVKPRRTLLQEASEPSTAPERLRQLAEHKNIAVHRAARKNPSLPEDVWRDVLLWDEPEAWANPMAPFYLLAWTQSEDDPDRLEYAARQTTNTLWKDPERCSTEGKALIATQIQTWWATCEEANDMMTFLGWWAAAKGNGSVEHREAVRILVLCVRTVPNITANPQTLDLLEAWSKGGADRRAKVVAWADSGVILDVASFAQEPRNSWSALYGALEVVERTSGSEARFEHERLLADLIRQEMPLPPVVD